MWGEHVPAVSCTPGHLKLISGRMIKVLWKIQLQFLIKLTLQLCEQRIYSRDFVCICIGEIVVCVSVFQIERLWI